MLRERLVWKPRGAGLALLVVLALAAWGCDPAASLSASNESAQSLLLRYTLPPEPDFVPDPAVWVLPAGTSGVAIPRGMGEASALVELLDQDCAVIDSWPSKHGGFILVPSDGAATFEDTAKVLPGDGPTLESTFDCLYTN